jgi:Protein of unknown function (DUF3105)
VPKKSPRRNDVRAANKDRRARLDEMRRQQRAQERRKNFLFIGSAVLVAVLLVGAAVGLAWKQSNDRAAKNKTGYVTTPTAAERAAGCTGVHNDPISGTAIHVPNQPIDYTKEKYGDTQGGTLPVPPSSGRHNPVPLNDQQRFYAVAGQPRPERAVHNLEHGYVDVWYDAALPQDQVAKLQLLASDPGLSRLLVVGWWQGNLPAGKHVVLTSWGRTERCASVSDAVIRAFYAKHVNSPLAPEATAGVLNGAQFPANDVVTQPTASPAPSPSASSSKK